MIEVNQTLHDVWPSPGLVHYIYIFVDSCPLTEFCQVRSSLCIQVVRFPILAALMQSTQAVGVSQTLRRGIRNGITELSLLDILNRGRHLYSEGGRHVWHRLTFWTFFFSSPILSGRRLDVYNTSAHDVALVRI